MNKDLPVAVVWSLNYAGYGIVRSLVGYNIPVIAFQDDFERPEAKTRLCQEIIPFTDADDLLVKSLVFAKKQAKKPVLYIIYDEHAELFYRNQDELEKYFLINSPSRDIFKMLRNKQAFDLHVLQQKLPVPRTLTVQTLTEFENILPTITFPVIVKPFVKTKEWLAANFDKAYKVKNRQELLDLYGKLESIRPEIVIQEWIPGKDSNVEYSLAYFDNEGKCLATFTGSKVRQWPPETGNTASTVPCDNDEVTKMTVDVLSNFGCKGFASLEFKRHDETGEYYIIEPTALRPDQQNYAATINGVNLPLIAYESLTGISFTHLPAPIKPVLYVDEWGDLASFFALFMKGHIGFLEYLSSLKLRSGFRYFDCRDKRVFIASIIKMITQRARKGILEIFRHS